MPNTKSAERRMRSSARKQVHNKTIKNRLKTLEKRFLTDIKAGKKDDAAIAYRDVTSAYDKAAKTGVVHRGKADRKKSRLSAHLAVLK